MTKVLTFDLLSVLQRLCFDGGLQVCSAHGTDGHRRDLMHHVHRLHQRLRRRGGRDGGGHSVRDGFDRLRQRTLNRNQNRLGGDGRRWERKQTLVDGCCTLVVDEEIPLYYVKRFEYPEKCITNTNDDYYYVN